MNKIFYYLVAPILLFNSILASENINEKNKKVSIGWDYNFNKNKESNGDTLYTENFYGFFLSYEYFKEQGLYNKTEFSFCGDRQEPEKLFSVVFGKTFSLRSKNGFYLTPFAGIKYIKRKEIDFDYDGDETNCKISTKKDCFYLPLGFYFNWNCKRNLKIGLILETDYNFFLEEKVLKYDGSEFKVGDKIKYKNLFNTRIELPVNYQINDNWELNFSPYYYQRIFNIKDDHNKEKLNDLKNNKIGLKVSVGYKF